MSVIFKYNLLLLTSTAVVLGYSAPVTSVFHTEGRIVGGTTAAAGEIPWQVSIQTIVGSQYCGGSIISSDWILTAAQCSDDIDLINYRVRSGTLRFTTGGAIHNIAQVIVHPLYNTKENNIAVWRVTPPFTMSSSTAAVDLPAQGTSTPDGTMMTVSGWGTTSVGGPVSALLLKVNVPIVSRATCNSNYAEFGGIPIFQICAGYPQGGSDSCQGDSGGPLFFGTSLRGVVSWGNGCALPNYPGVYAEVSAYRNWITQQTGV